MSLSPARPRRFLGDWTVLEQSVSLPLHLHLRLRRQFQRMTSEIVSCAGLFGVAADRIGRLVRVSGPWKSCARWRMPCEWGDSVPAPVGGGTGTPVAYGHRTGRPLPPGSELAGR